MKHAPKELCVAGSPADRLPLAKLKMPPLEALSVSLCSMFGNRRV